MSNLELRIRNKINKENANERKCGSCGLYIVENPKIIIDNKGYSNYFHIAPTECAKAVREKENF